MNLDDVEEGGDVVNTDADGPVLLPHVDIIGNRIMVSNNNLCDLQHLPIVSK